MSQQHWQCNDCKRVFDFDVDKCPACSGDDWIKVSPPPADAAPAPPSECCKAPTVPATGMQCAKCGEMWDVRPAPARQEPGVEAVVEDVEDWMRVRGRDDLLTLSANGGADKFKPGDRVLVTLLERAK